MKWLFILVLIGGFLYGTLNINMYTKRVERDVERNTTIKKEKEARLRAEQDFNSLVQRESERLGTDRLDTVRDIIRVWGRDYRVGLAISKAESGLRCEAYHFNTNGTVDHSAFQLNDVHNWRGNLNDCMSNIKIAYQIYQEQGGNPWVVFWKGIYLKYL